MFGHLPHFFHPSSNPGWGSNNTFGVTEGDYFAMMLIAIHQRYLPEATLHAP